jgi:hypothetical protein
MASNIVEPERRNDIMRKLPPKIKTPLGVAGSSTSSDFPFGPSLDFSPPANQWTILASSLLFNPKSFKHKVISIATGTKCLRIPTHGEALCDSHAEVHERYELRGCDVCVDCSMRRCATRFLAAFQDPDIAAFKDAQLQEVTPNAHGERTK